MADLSDQLRIQQQINKVLSDRQALLKANADLMSQQAALSKQMCDAMSGTGLKEAEKTLRRVGGGAKEAADGVRNLGGEFKSAEKRAKEAAEEMDRMYKKAILVGGAVGALKGLRMGFGMLRNVVGGAFRAVSSLVGGLFKIGKAVLSIPFKIFGGLVDMAQGMGSPVFLQALEEVRKTFGDIATGSGRALRNSAFEIRREFNSLTKSSQGVGASFGRVFGYGQQGLAEALKFNAELATELGGSFAGMRDKIKGNFAELAIYRKGLGLTAKQQAMFMKMTDKAGGDFMARFKSISSMSIQVGKSFGYSSKEIGQTLGKMFENVKVFGGFTDKQLVSMAVQTKRLGIELEGLVSVAEGFDDYNEAAKSVGNLNRVFGMQVDTMKLFNEQDPAARIQQLQKAFKDAGNSVEGMSRQQLKFLAANAKVSEEEAKLIFSKKGLEEGYDKVKKKTSKAQSKEMKMAKVMLNLSKQIERVFGSGGKKYKGFFDAFTGGFGEGVVRTREFRKVLRNINKSLRITRRAGRRVGRAFVKHFPGVKTFLGALADFFNPRKFAPMAREMTKEIEKFFKALRPGNEREAFETFGKNAKKILEKYFGGKGEALELMRTSFDTIATIFGNLKLIFAEKVLDGAANGLTALTTFLEKGVDKDGNFSFSKIGSKGADAFGEGMTSRFGDNASKLMNTFVKKFIPALKKAAPMLGKVAFAIFDGIRNFMMEHKDVIIEGLGKTMALVFKLKAGAIWWLIKNEPTVALGMAAILFGPSLAGAAIGALAPILMKKVLPSVLGKIAASGFGAKLMTTLIPESGVGKSMVADSFYDAFTAPTNSNSFLGKVKSKMGNFFGKIGTGLSKVPGLGRITSAIGGAFSMGAIGKAVPWVGVAYGLYEGVKRGIDKYDKSGKTEDFFKGVGGGMVSSLTLGLVSPESGEKIMGAVGFLGTGITRGFDRYQKTGSFGQSMAAFAGGMVEGITFGLVDGDKFEDTLVNIFGGESNRYLDRITKEFEVSAKKHADEFGKHLKPIFDKVRGAIDGEIKDLRGLQTEIGEALFFAKKAGDKKGQDALNSFSKGLDGVEKMLKEGKDNVKDYEEKLKKERGAINATMEKVAKELENDQRWHDVWDDNIEIPAEKMSKAMKDALRSKNLISHDADGIITLDGDKKEEIKKVLESLKKSDNEIALVAAKAKGQAMAKGEKAILGLTTESMIEAGQAMARAGKNTDKVEEMLKKRAVIEAKTAALIKRGWAKETIDKYGTEYALEFMRKKASGAAMGEFQAEVDDFVKNKTEGPIKAIREANAEFQREEKLTKLEAAKVTMDRLEELKDIPQKLEALQAKFESIDEVKMQALAKKAVGAASKIAAAMDEAMKGPEGKALATKTSAKVSDSIMDLLRDTSEIATSVEAFMKADIGDAATSATKVANIQAAIQHLQGMFMPEYGPEMFGSIDYSTKADQYVMLAKSVGDIVEALTYAAPSDLSTTVKAVTKGLQESKKMLKELDKTVDVKSVMELTSALSNGGTLTVQNDPSKKQPINISIDLNVNAKTLARNIVEVEGVNKDDAKSQIVTTAYALGKRQGRKKIAAVGPFFGHQVLTAK